MIFAWLHTNEVPQTWKQRARELCLPPGRNDPAGGTMYRWTYHDGSTWMVFAFHGPTFMAPGDIVGWACLTLEEEPQPVIGVYVDPKVRGVGYGSYLVQQLLMMNHKLIDHFGGEVIAVQDRFPKYKELIEAAGFKQKDWS